MTPVRFLGRMAAALCLASLAGCGIPDGIAYGVKAIQHYNEGPVRPARPAAAPAAAPTPVVIEAVPQAAPPPPAAPQRRESISVEELPAR